MASFLNKYMKNDGDEEITITDPASKFNLSKGHLPNYDRELESHDKAFIKLPKSSSYGESIVKEGYTSPIKLDTKYKTGEIKLVKLEVDPKKEEGVLVPLQVDPKTGKEVIVSLDVDNKKGEAQLVKLDVDPKTGNPKLIGLDVPILKGNERLIGLNVDDKQGSPKLIELEVDHKSKEAKLVELSVESIEGKEKLVTLDVKSNSSEPKTIKLKVDERISSPKVIVLEVDKKTSEPRVVDLNVTPITGNSKLVGLTVNPITGSEKLVKLDVTPITGEPKLVMLEVDPITGEPKLVDLDTSMKGYTSGKGNGVYRENPGSEELVRLNVSGKSADPKLVKLDVDHKIGTPKLVMLEVDPITGEPKLVKLDVTPITGEPKLVMLEVNPIEGQAKIVMLDVPKIEGQAKIVMLDVDPKTGTPKLVMLEVDPITGEPKLVRLNVDKKTGQVKLIELRVDTKMGRQVLVPLKVDEKIGESDIIVLPNNENESVDLSKYQDYVEGTDVPSHSPRNKQSSLVDENGDINDSAIEKYKSIAEWMGIPGISGIQAAKDYEEIMNIYDRLGSVGDRMKSYITASVSGSGDEFIQQLPSHSGSVSLGNGVTMRAANNAVRSIVANSGSGMNKLMSLAGGALTGETNFSSIISSIKTISASKGEAKAKAIHNTLGAINNLYIQLQSKTKSFSGNLPGTNGALQSAATSILNGDLTGAINTAYKGIKNVLKPSSNDPINVPRNKKNNFFEEGEDFEDPRISGTSLSIGGILGKLVGGSNGGEYGWSNGTKTVKWKDRFGTNIPASNITLTELMGIGNAESLDLSDLRDELNKGVGYITNYKGNILGTPLNEMGLDSNHIWEMTLEPLISDTLNGGFTYLPNIWVMNEINKRSFKVNSSYTRWIPFTGFELQNSKMTNKSLQLFDGDISYPVSLEFTNELRITIADDAIKTFKRYFQMCMECSMYRSNPYVWNGDSSDPSIDKNYMEVAMYKNVTWACTIYVMTSGFMCVKKFPLLVTLKDFQEEYSGDIESGPTELALMFSIVGENEIDQIPSELDSSTKMSLATSRNRSNKGDNTETEKFLKNSVNNSSSPSLASLASKPSPKMTID